MAQSSCAKCGSHSFETVQSSPQSVEERVSFVQCAQCGTVVGVIGGEDLRQMLLTLMAWVRRLAAKEGVDLLG